MWFLNTILDIVFPASCVSCKTLGEDFCTQCLANAPTTDRETESWIFPLFDYRHPPIKKAIWLLKYKGKRRLARVFAEALYPHMLEELSDIVLFENFHNALLIPIPLSKKRHRERGFNQTELIARELVLLDKGTNFNLVTTVLTKPKETVHQAHVKERKDRVRNLLGTFSVQKRDQVAGRNIILIDDVTTTGATLKEARSVLRANGAKKIIAFTVAH